MPSASLAHSLQNSFPDCASVKSQAVRVSFRFGMQKVLDYREQCEEEAKVRLARCRQRLQEAGALLDALAAQLQEARSALAAAPLMETADRWLHEQHIKGLEADVASAALQKRMQEQLTDEARKLLAARTMDRKVLEKLKERHCQRHMREDSLKEQRANDEAATLRYKISPF